MNLRILLNEAILGSLDSRSRHGCRRGELDRVHVSAPPRHFRTNAV